MGQGRTGEECQLQWMTVREKSQLCGGASLYRFWLLLYARCYRGVGAPCKHQGSVSSSSMSSLLYIHWIFSHTLLCRYRYREYSTRSNGLPCCRAHALLVLFLTSDDTSNSQRWSPEVDLRGEMSSSPPSLHYGCHPTPHRHRSQPVMVVSPLPLLVVVVLTVSCSL